MWHCTALLAGLLTAAVLGVAGPREAAAQVTWSGTSSDWSLNTNWTPTTALVNSGTYSLVFAGTPTALSSTNTLTNLVLGTGSTTAIRFDTSGFTLSGNAITLSGTNLQNFAATGTNTINLGLSVAATRTVTGTGGSTLVLGGGVSGAGGLSFARTSGGSGVANFILSGSNDFTGGLRINASSILTFTSTNALGRNVASNKLTIGASGAVLTNQAGSFTLQNNVDYDTIGGGATVNVGAGNNLTIDGTTTFVNGNGANGLTVGSGTLTVRTWAGQHASNLPGLGGGTMVVKEDAQADFTKGFIINSGTLLMGAANALGTGTVQLRGGVLATTKDLTLSMPLSGSSGSIGGDFNVTVSSTIAGTSFSKVGTGTLTLTANNTFTGAATASAGHLRLSGSNAGSATLNGASATLLLDNANAVGGTLTLTNGTLANVALTTLAGNRPITLGAAAGGTVSFGGPVDLDLGNGAIAGGLNNPTFNITSNALRLGVNITTSAQWSPKKIGDGTLIIAGTTTITTSNGNWDIYGGVMRFDQPASMPGGSGTSGNTQGFRVYNGAIGLGFTSGTFTRGLALANTGLNLAVATGTSGFAGYGSTTQYVNIGGTSASFTFGGGASSTNFLRSGTAFGFGAPDATQAVEFQNPLNLNGAEQTIVAIRGQVDLVGILSGVLSNGSLRKDGLGTLALTAANTYTGTTTISAGTLQIGNNGSTGSLSNSSRVSVATGATLAFSRSNAISYSGTVSGAGGLTKLGSEALTLGGANTYTGATTIASGTLITGIANAISGSSAITIGSAAARGFLKVDHALSISNLTFTGLGGDISSLSTGTVTLTAASGTATITVLGGTNAFHANATLGSPTLVDVASNALFSFHNNLAGGSSLTKSGAGTMELVGDNDTLSGNLFITGGRVNVGAGMNQIGTGTTTLSGGSIIDLGGQAFTDRIVVLNGTILNAGGTATTTTIAGPATVSGTTVQGTYNITSTGSALFSAVVGDGSSLVNVNVNSGAGSGGQAVFGSAVAANGNVVVNQGGTATFSDTVSGNVISHGASTFNGSLLSGAETQVQSGGSATFAAATAAGSIVSIASGGSGSFAAAVAGQVNVSGSATFGSASSLTGSLYTNAGGVATLDNVNAALGGAIHNEGQLVVNRSSGSQTIASLIDGDGSLVKQGAGLLMLTASNSFTGPTTISAGSIMAANSYALGSGTVSIGSAGSLRLEEGTILSNAIVNSGTLLFAGGGLQRMSDEGLATVAQLLAGGSTSAVALNPSFAWSARIDGVTYSDVLDLTNTGGTIQILQLSYNSGLVPDGGEASIFLGWDQSGSWVNAINGNIGSAGGSAVTDANSSFAALGIQATSAYLGSWGRDTTTNTVWAVVDHNSSYAAITIIVPEPGTILSAGIGIALVGWTGWKRRRGRRMQPR